MGPGRRLGMRQVLQWCGILIEERGWGVAHATVGVVDAKFIGRGWRLDVGAGEGHGKSISLYNKGKNLRFLNGSGGAAGG